MKDIISGKLQRFSVVLIDIIVNFELVNGGNLIRTCYSETRLDYLIIKLVIAIIDDVKIGLLNETKSFLFHFFHKLITLFNFSLAGKNELSIFLCVLLRKQVYHVTNFARKTEVSSYKLCGEKSIKLQMLALKK